MSKSFILSSEGLKNIVKTKNEFHFYFGGRDLHMNNIFAEFLSPYVSHLHNSDPTINSIHFNIPKNSNYQNFDEIVSDEIISLFSSICNGSSISINKEQSIKIQIISILIGNEELYKKMDEIFPDKKDQLSIENCIKKLKMHEFYLESSNFINIDFTNIFDTVAKNFNSIEKNELLKMSKSTLYKIIKNRNLQIENEDSLFDLINEIYQKSTNEEQELSITDFYEEIKLKNLSDEKFSQFLQALNPNEITGNLWKNICNRFIINEASKESSRYIKGKNIHFDYNKTSSNSFNGIIYNLTKECGGNVNDKGIVNVTASSENSKSRLAKFAVDLDKTKTYFRSDNQQNAWLMFDFKEKKIHPTHYSIRTKPTGKDGEHAKNWVVEASNDNKNWIKLDEKKDETALNDESAFHTFQIQEKIRPDQYFQYIRIRQTGTNCYGDFYFNIACLEYFGSLI